ncbi:MAG TPA: protein kinase [Pirellulales bacterium]|nr:protein kinase [Pirellulales bacterium]
MTKPGSSHRPLELTPSAHGAGADGLLPVGPPCDPDEKTVITQRPPAPAAGPARQTAPFELGQLLAGEKLNHFQLKEYVGGGGMGAVFRAVDTMLNREVALKVLSRDQGADDETRRRFQNEAQSAARLDHENIARVYYVGEDKGLYYIVFEFIEGINLRELIEQKGILPLPEAVSYTLQISEALAHACGRDVVHRDIKPSNVIITATGRAKLVDMGLARLHQVHPDGDDLTASGVTLGTFDYISPEQARDPRGADVRSDIYSLGCTLYFMLTARPPFPDGTVLQKLLQHSSDAPPDPRELNPTLPEEVSVVVRKLLAKDPRRRPQHPRDLIHDLYVLAEQVGFTVSGGKDPNWAPAAAARPSSIRRHIPWMVPVAGLLCGVALLDYLGPTLDSLAGVPADDATANVGSPGPPSPRTAADDEHGEASADDPRSGRQPDAGMPATDSRADDGAAGAQPAPRAVGPAPRGDMPSDEPAKSSDLPNHRAPASAPAPDDMPDGPSDETTLPSEPSDDARPTQRPATDAGPSDPSTTSLAPLPQGLLVVCDEPRGERYFASLRAACATAKNGDAIELRFDGPRDETPFTLSNVRLTIRAGEKFRPAIVFRPSNTDTVAYPRGMITVAGGSLVLRGVALELDMPRMLLSENWALVETQRADSVVLDGCTLTVRNASDQGGAYHLDVSMFDVKAAPGSDAMMLAMGMTPVEPVKIQLRDCVARGEAVFLRSNDLQPLDLSWNNGLLATSERLLAAGGGVTAPAQGVGQTRIELKHLTAAVAKGLCRLAGSHNAPWLLDTEIQCADSIIVAGEKDAAMIEQLGADRVNNLQRRVAWRGDHNVYQGFDGFWKVTDLTSAAAPLSFTFEQWTAYWAAGEIRSSDASVSWAHPPGLGRPAHRREPADYALDPRQASEILSGAGDFGPLGLIADRLPGEPVPRAADPP